MIIFGTRSVGKLLATLYFACRNCGNPAAQQLARRTTWFTLFFVPLVPFRTTRSLTCTFCGVRSKVSKDEADQLIAGAQQPAHPQQHPTQPPAPYGR